MTDQTNNTSSEKDRLTTDIFLINKSVGFGITNKQKDSLTVLVVDLTPPSTEAIQPIPVYFPCRHNPKV